MARLLTYSYINKNDDNYINDNDHNYDDNDYINNTDSTGLFIFIGILSIGIFICYFLFIIYVCFPYLFKKSKIKIENLNINFEIEKYDENTEYCPEICIICLDIFSKNQNIIKLECDHYFHENCIKEWFEKKTRCPYCKN